MAEVCSLCGEPLQADSICTELLCHHKFHTACLIDEGLELECTICEDQGVFYDHANTAPHITQEQVLKLYDDDAVFRRQLKAYVDATKACSKPRKALADLARQKKQQLSIRYAQIRAEVEALYETKKDELVSSEEYKAYRKAVQKHQASYSRLRTNYRDYTHRLSDLREKPGLRTLRPYWQTHCYRPTTFIRRAILFRYRRY